MLDEMMDNIVRKYGFESAETIEFFSMCEDIEISILRVIWFYLMLMEA